MNTFDILNTISQRVKPKPSKLNIIATEKYKAWSKFKGLPQLFAKMKYIEVVQHFASGGASSFIDSANSQSDDFTYEEDEQVDEDGCPLHSEEEFDGLGVKLSTLNNAPINDGDAVSPESKLRHACIQNNTQLLQQSIDDGVNVNGCDESGQTPLHFAVDRGNMECIRLLINNGANVNAVDCDGISVLLTGAMVGDLDIVRLLLESGADPDATDEDGETARTFVNEDGNVDMMDLFATYTSH
jgi:ankyrin repeat protein